MATSYSGAVKSGSESTSLQVPPSRRCVSCEKEGIMPLKCKIHKKCAECLQKNADLCGVQDMFVCMECDKPMDTGIWIFVDDSNIWIEAKKLASKLKGFKSVEDHRLRISIGRLTDVVANERKVEDAFLYGSEPPKIDDVWNKIRDHGWKVKTKEKSIITRKEKEVDAQLVADVTQIACKTPVYQRGTIVLISGDADVCPAVEKIVEENNGWKVEIYMWEDVSSPRLKALSIEYPDIVIWRALDENLGNVTFTERTLPVRFIKSFKKNCAVFLMEEGCFPDHKIDDIWWNKLESIAQWPVEYWWFVNDDEEITDELALVFRARREVRTYDVSEFVKTISDNISHDEPSLPFVKRAETYVDFDKRLAKYWAMTRSEKFNGFVDIEQDLIYQNSIESDGVDCQSPSKVSHCDYQSVPPSKVGGEVLKCIFGKNCRQGIQCQYRHSKSDEWFFERNGGKGNPMRKIKMCTKYATGKCKYAPHLCNYAHGEADAWCLNCRTTGHVTDKCPK